MRRLSGRWICTGPTASTSTTSAGHPPKVAGRVRHRRRARCTSATDDQPETIRARLEKQLPPMYEVVDYYADAAC